MWFEIIPSYAIIAGAMAIPTVGIYFSNKLVYGNAYRRNLTERWDRLLYQRDCRLTNDSPYTYKGLDAIPDKCDTQETQETKTL